MLWIPAHVGIPDNEFIDEKAKNALNDEIDQSWEVAERDLKKITKNIARERWEKEWNKRNNCRLLFKFKKHTKSWQNLKYLKRKEMIKITRLRLGYTNFTHSYLMEKSNKPKSNDN